MDWDWASDPLVDLGMVVGTHVDDHPNASYFDLELDGPRHPWYGRPMPIDFKFGRNFTVRGNLL